MTSRRRNRRPGGPRAQGRPRPAQPRPGPVDDKVLAACLSFLARLPQPYRRIPQPWHFIAKLVTVAALLYVSWGVITAVVSAIVSFLLMLAFGGFTLAVLVGTFKYSMSEEGRREEERWYEENDPRGNGPRGAL
ncbi:copper transporter family protein [Streptomyces sp. NPDC004135]